MGRGIELRGDYGGSELRSLARSCNNAKQARRLLALSLIYDGSRRSDAARHADVSPQTVRDWILRFNSNGPDGLIDGKSSGTPPRLSAPQRAALVRVVEAGPMPGLHGVMRWRLCDLVAWVCEEFGVSLALSS